jgi:galactosamine-6-phosphate isomerase
MIWSPRRQNLQMERLGYEWSKPDRKKHIEYLMKIEVLSSYDTLSNRAKEIIIREIRNKRRLLLCTATGGTPTGVYDLLGEEGQRYPEVFEAMRIIKLDEWGGIPPDHPATCETYLQEHLLKSLHISADRYIGFNSNPDDPEAECQRIQERLDHEAPIDLCILGLGMNGHLAFNEPAEFLLPHCHVATLTGESKQHDMVSGMKNKPTFGLTLGMADILRSRMILMMINGEKKREITRRFLSGEISTSLPASFLWLHNNVICLMDKAAADS